MKLLVAIKKFIEAEGDKVSIAELKEFSTSLTDAERVQFAAELTELMGVEVVAA